MERDTPVHRQQPPDDVIPHRGEPMNKRIIKDPCHGYLRMDPLPAKEELERFYRDHYYGAITNHRDFSLEPKSEELEFFAWRCADMIDAVREHFGKTAGVSILDIGCGYGYSLEHFKEAGMEPYGIEPSAEAAAYASGRGFQVIRHGIGEEAPDFGKKFDVVLLMDVLEHLIDPAAALALARLKLLRPGGLLIVDVPNDFNDFQTAADAEYNLDTWWVAPPQHINYFTAESIAQLLETCGFGVKGAESSFPMELFLLMGDVYVGNPGLGRQCHGRRVAFERLMRKHKPEKLKKLYRALAQLGLGRQVVVYAVNPADAPANP